MKKPLFTGLCTALVTPFLGERVNLPLFRLLARRQVEAGASALVVAGTTGEAPTLSDDERLQLLEAARQEAPGIPIIAGTGTNSTEHTLQLSREAEAAGADAVLVVAPYYNRPTPDGLLAHFMTVAHGLRIPVILYDVPSRTGVEIPVEVCRRLGAIPNIAGIKAAGPDIRKITRLRSACPELPIWGGNDDMAAAAMALGAGGLISAAANVLPEEFAALTEAALSGDFDSAESLQTGLQPTLELLYSETNPVVMKAALTTLGFDCGTCRLPLSGPSAEVRKKVGEFFRQ